jgi:Smg protein
MKESVFDVLMYLFENFLYDDEAQPDRAALESELFQAGFSHREVRKALNWLDDLAESREHGDLSINGSQSIRVFTTDEADKLSLDSRGFLIFLEQVGVLTPTNRELVIDRLMALDDDEVDQETVKWVVLMVLFNQPGEEEAYACVETLLFDGPIQLVH